MRGPIRATRYRPRAGLTAVCLSLLLAGCGATLLPAAHRAELAGNENADATVTVTPTVVGDPIPSGFVGVSLEYPALTAYAGSDPAHVDPVLVHLIDGLAPGQSPVIRIGGDSTDTTWWPVAGMTRPPGVTFSLSPRWLAVLRALGRDLHARLILGVNMEAHQPLLTRVEAYEFVSALGSRSIRALELGNEPGRYAMFAWYHNSNGSPVYARSQGYSLSQFTREFTQVAPLMPHGMALAGPALAGYEWMSGLGGFIAAAPRLGLLTFHRYPLDRCFTGLHSPHFPSVENLLEPQASRLLAQRVAPYVALARRRDLPLRIDELNTVACGGKYGVSNTFASALWAMDTLFAMAEAGVAGVNIHTFPTAAYQLFGFSYKRGGWTAAVRPEYYGLWMFAHAAPPGARLLETQSSSVDVRGWATRSADGTIRVLLINDNPARRYIVRVRSVAGGVGGLVLALRAPSVDATSGVELGATSVGARSGRLRGPLRITRAPSPASGQYLVELPAASAALLTLYTS